MLLDIAGCHGMVLDVAGGCWVLLDVVQCCWNVTKRCGMLLDNADVTVYPATSRMCMHPTGSVHASNRWLIPWVGALLEPGVDRDAAASVDAASDVEDDEEGKVTGCCWPLWIYKSLDATRCC